MGKKYRIPYIYINFSAYIRKSYTLYRMRIYTDKQSRVRYWQVYTKIRNNRRQLNNLFHLSLTFYANIRLSNIDYSVVFHQEPTMYVITGGRWNGGRYISAKWTHEYTFLHIKCQLFISFFSSFHPLFVYVCWLLLSEKLSDKHTFQSRAKNNNKNNQKRKTNGTNTFSVQVFV